MRGNPIFAPEVTSTGPPVRQNKPYCSRGDLDRPSRAPELALLLTRRPRQALPCARTSPPAHEATSTGSPVRRTSLPAHEATSTGSPVRRTSPPAHEATSTGSPVRRTGLTAHEVTSTDSPVRQNKPCCSRGDLDRPSSAPESHFCSRDR